MNCRPIYFTGQQCDVQGFHDDFTPVQDVPIATVATAWSDPFTGQGYILILHETLYFGNNMNHSLINPNQLRHFGVEVFDNPYDPDPSRTMGIKIPESNELLPFLSQGSTIFFTSRYPTDMEMDSYPHIVVTSDQQWDPQIELSSKFNTTQAEILIVTMKCMKQTVLHIPSMGTPSNS